MLSKIKKRLNQIYSLNKYFGVRIAFFTLLEAIFNYEKRPIKAFLRISKKKQKLILNYLYNNYSDLICNYRNHKSIGLNDKDSINSKKIWVFWWQGYDNAPELIKTCIDSIVKNNNNHEVVFITQDNIKEYLELPLYVIKKFEEGIISYTEFSDISRIGLLNKYGGLWLDATFLVTDVIPNEIFGYSFYTGRLETDDNITSLSSYRWNTAFMAGNASNTLFSFINDFNLKYWEREDYLIDYFLLDHIISIAYENIDFIKQQIDNVPINNPNLFKLNHQLNTEYNSESFQELIKNTIFHKLQRRQMFHDKTKANQLTYYGYIMKCIDVKSSHLDKVLSDSGFKL